MNNQNCTTSFMKGKTLVISGATRGIGKAILYKFAQNGVNIAFTYNKNEEEAVKIAQDVESKFSIKARFYPLNVLEPEQYVELFKKIDEDFSRIDFFVSNAIIYGKSVAGGFAPFMRLKPRGLNAGHGNSKNAVETMVKYAATELGEWGIRVNAVSGGPIDTDALKAFPDYAEVKAKVEEQSPLNRMGTPEDLAGAAFFLCDETQSAWLTGQTIVIDGGTTFK